MGLFASYDIEDVIAEGDLATVYKCGHASSKQPLAVKVLSQQLLDRHPEIVDHFKREASVLARLNHPNLVQLVDLGVAGGLPYLVMTYIDGASLKAVLERNKIDLRRKLSIALQVCKGLAYAHRNGVVHGDFKPANVLIGATGSVTVADFGFAKLVDTLPGEQGPIMGDPHYLAPEQKAGAGIAVAGDVYSLGVVLYELFAGHLPEQPLAFPSYFDPAVPAYVDEIVTRCLSPEPDKRFPSADAVREKLLDSMWGAHLEEARKKAVLEGVDDIKTRFAVLDIIRQTPFGTVYLCENTVNHNRVIVKKVAGSMEGYKEANALCNLQHPNVINIYSASKVDDDFVIVMEYLHGGSLKDRLVRPWDWRHALLIAKQICQGVSYLHKHQLIHGNLRPSNVLFGLNEVKISDCSLAHHYTDQQNAANWYAYPNEAPGPLGDIYAAGAILYEMLTASAPVWNRGQLVENAAFKALPGGLQAMVTRMLAQVPKDRYRSVEEVVAEIKRLQNPNSIKTDRQPAASRPGVTPLLLTLLGLSVVAAVLFYLPDLRDAVIGTVKTIFRMD
jgi:serine/threonine protein kinase